MGYDVGKMVLTKDDVITLFNELSDKLIVSIKANIEQNLKSVIDKKFSAIFKKLDEVRNLANETSKSTKWCEDQIETIKETHTDELASMNKQLDDLTEKHDLLSKALDTSSVRACVLERKLEDQINRSSRNSLVFKGIRENDKESWLDTQKTLSKVISETADDVTRDEAFDMIERCHRNPHPPTRVKQGKRDINVLFRSWDDSQYVLKQFRMACIRGESNGVSADQKFGVVTTARRNHALHIRKELKSAGTIAHGYVAYPAKLLVKYRSSDAKFHLHEDFSQMEVQPRQTNTDNEPHDD